MKIAIHQPQYLPWLGYFDKLDSADVFIFLDTVQFKKHEWQNRNRIRTKDGWQWLTVPIIDRFPEQIERVARRIVDHGLSVRQTEEAVAHLVQPLVRKTEKQRIVDPNVREAENTLQEALGVRVTIDDRKGKGKILIEYSSLEDFDRIIEALGGKKMD